MAFTGRLGTDDSQFGNLELGSEGEGVVERTATDSVTLSESVERAGVFSRTTTDAPTTSDSATRGVSTPRTTTDAVSLSESAEADVSSGNFVATTEEAVTLSESAARQLTITRSAADSPTASESGSRMGGFSRGAADGPTISESASAEIVIVPNAFQSSAFQSSPAFQTEQGVVVRSASDAVALSDTAEALTGEIATATDSVTVSATASVNKAARRNIFQTVTLSSPASRAGSTFFRTASEAVTVSATALPGFVYQFTSTAAATITDSATAEKSYVRTAKDSTTGAFSVWPMDDAGSSLRDNVDSNPLTQNGVVPSYQVSSPTGGGVEFNNSAYFQNTSPTGLPTGASARTIEFWFKGFSSATQTVFSYGTNSTRQSFHITLNEGGSNRIGVRTTGDDGSVSAPGLLFNTWQRITVTFDGTTTRFYRDGALQGTDTYGGALNTTVSAAGLVVGRDHHTAANFLRSSSIISGLQVWDRALSAAEVAGDTVAISGPTLTRPQTDAIVVSDSATRAAAFLRTVTDTTSVTESTAETVGEAVAFTATDAVTVTDVATFEKTFVRTATDGVGVPVSEVCYDFDAGIPAAWTNDPFDPWVASGGEIVNPSNESTQMGYTGTTPAVPTAAQFDFRTPGPIDDDYWFVEVDTYGKYILIDNFYSSLGTFGLYTEGAAVNLGSLMGPLVADTYYTVKAHMDPTGASQIKVWLQGDPEPPDWMVDEDVPVSSTWGHAIFAAVDGAGELAVDNVCFTYSAAGVSDSISTSKTFTRSLTDTVETDDWIVNNGTVDEPVYGQVPNGYQPGLANPIDEDDTTIVVTQPLPPGTQLPILVYINGEWVLVTAVSPDGLTWTVVRGQNGSTAVAHGTGVILPANTTVSVGGVQVGAFVQYNKTRLSTYANGHVGTGEIWIRDVDRTMSFTTGAEVVVRHRNVRVWGGYIANIKRVYAFPGGTGEPGNEPRFLVLEVVDYNILLRKRVYHNKFNPLNMKVKTWPNGTHDDVVIGYMLNHSLNVGDDGLSYDIHHVGTPGLPVDSCNPDAPDRFQIAWAGYTWYDAMRAIADQTGAIYYIDPDKVFRYVDDSTKQSAFGYTGLSDDPSGTVVGYRDFELSNDATKLVNEQFTWGAGQGNTEMVLGHEFDSDSVEDHGLWQQAEVRYDMYCQGTVDLRAETWLDGSPQNHRGYKEDHIAVRATVFHPYFRVADVITVESTSFDFDDVIPVRGAEISFPTPWDIQCVLTISHEYDSPWEAYEFAFPNFPDFKFDFDIDPIDPIPPWNPYDPCAGDDTPEVVSGGETVDEDVWPGNHRVDEGQMDWINGDAASPSYWEFRDNFEGLSPLYRTASQNPGIFGDYHSASVGSEFGFGFLDRVYHSGIFRTPTGDIDEGPPLNVRASTFHTFKAPENTVVPNAPLYCHIEGRIRFTGVMKNRPQYPDIAGFQTGLYQNPLPPTNFVLSVLLEDHATIIPVNFLNNPLTPGLAFLPGAIGSPIWEGTLESIGAVDDFTSQEGWVPFSTDISLPSGKHWALSLQIAAESTEEGIVTQFPDGLQEIVWNGAGTSGATIAFSLKAGSPSYSHNPEANEPEADLAVEVRGKFRVNPAGVFQAGRHYWFQLGLRDVLTGNIPGGGDNIYSIGAYRAYLSLKIGDNDAGGGDIDSGYLTVLSATDDFFATNYWPVDPSANLYGGELVLPNVGSNWFWVKLRVEADSVKAAAWQDGESESTLWAVQTDRPVDSPPHTAANLHYLLMGMVSDIQRGWDIECDEITVTTASGAFTETFTRSSTGGWGFSELGQQWSIVSGVDSYALVNGSAAASPASPASGHLGVTNIDDLGLGGGVGGPCEGLDSGELEDPSDQPLYGVPPISGVLLENGNYLYTFDVQFLPGSTEVWADGLRLRLDEDYDEHPENAAIEIHSDAQSGFTVFDPGMVVVANLIPFITHDPPPEYEP